MYCESCYLLMKQFSAKITAKPIKMIPPVAVNPEQKAINKSNKGTCINKTTSIGSLKAKPKSMNKINIDNNVMISLPVIYRVAYWNNVAIDPVVFINISLLPPEQERYY